MTAVAALTLSSSRNDLTIWAAIGACAGVYLFYRGFRILQRKRLILNTPTSKIRSASMGLVEVSGLAVGPYTMPSPITGTACYYYRTVAWELRQSGKNKEWKKVADENLHVPFYLDDNTGRILVDPRDAEMDLHCDFREEYSHSLFFANSDVPANVSTFLARHGISTDNKIKIEEFCIKPKNALFILGTLGENPGLQVTAPTQGVVSRAVAAAMESTRGDASLADLDYDSPNHDSQKEIIRLSPSQAPENSREMTAQGKIAAAMMKAGITNPAAWETAGVLPATVSDSTGVAAATAPAEEFDLLPKTVLMKGYNNPAFFISWRSQREVVESLGWKSILMIWGGPALTVVSMYILAAQLGWL